MGGVAMDRAVICGQGPSWAYVDTGELAEARDAGAAVIAVNGAVELVEADVFFTLDLSDANRERIAEPIPGVEYVVAAPEPEADQLSHVTYLTRVAREAPDGPWPLRAHRQPPGGLSEDPDAIHTGNSAFGALNLAYLRGAKRVVLLGVDGFGYQRWDGTRNRYLEHMPSLFAGAVPQLDEAGVHVVNGSPETAVGCFPILMPSDALRWLVTGDGPWEGESLPMKEHEPRRPPPGHNIASELLRNRIKRFRERGKS